MAHKVINYYPDETATVLQHSGQEQGSTPTTTPVAPPPETTETPEVKEPGEAAVAQQQTEQALPAGQSRAEQHREASMWDAGFQEGLKTMPDKSIADAIISYNNYAKGVGKEPLDILEIWPVMQNNDITKTIEENEKNEKKRERRDKWEQTANVLNHLGSFIGTLFGAPAQEIESPIELSKRQQMLRDRTLEQRRQQNSDFWKIYQAQQAERRAAEKEKREAAYQQGILELKQREADNREARLYLDIDKFNWKKQIEEGKFDLEKAKFELKKEVDRGRLSQGAAKIALDELKANYITVKTDKEGNVTTTTHTVGNTAPAAPAAPASGSKSLGIGVGQTR